MQVDLRFHTVLSEGIVKVVAGEKPIWVCLQLCKKLPPNKWLLLWSCLKDTKETEKTFQ